ncbi:MAG: hypothetical protein HPY74_20815 [Firmicutes bacterium]|nr:hypothetical protein [Bacillota bacterium]
MYIINQDRDEVFTLNDKHLFPARLYVEDRYYNGQFMGWNIMGKHFLKKVLLGTYDTEEDAKQVVGEIFRMLKTGMTHYAMPEPALDLEDL